MCWQLFCYDCYIDVLMNSGMYHHLRVKNVCVRE